MVGAQEMRLHDAVILHIWHVLAHPGHTSLMVLTTLA